MLPSVWCFRKLSLLCIILPQAQTALQMECHTIGLIMRIKLKYIFQTWAFMTNVASVYTMRHVIRVSWIKQRCTPTHVYSSIGQLRSRNHFQIKWHQEGSYRTRKKLLCFNSNENWKQPHRLHAQSNLKKKNCINKCNTISQQHLISQNLLQSRGPHTPSIQFHSAHCHKIKNLHGNLSLSVK